MKRNRLCEQKGQVPSFGCILSLTPRRTWRGPGELESQLELGVLCTSEQLGFARELAHKALLHAVLFPCQALSQVLRNPIGKHYCFPILPNLRSKAQMYEELVQGRTALGGAQAAGLGPLLRTEHRVTSLSDWHSLCLQLLSTSLS